MFRRLCIFNRFIALILLVSFLTLVGWNSCIVTQRITPQIRHPWERGEYEFLKTLSDKLPNDVYIITPDPGFLISVINKKSIRTDVLLKKRFFPRRLIFFKGVQWEMGARRDADVYKTIEGFLREIYRFEVLERKIFFPGYETTFYNLTLKTPGD